MPWKSYFFGPECLKLPLSMAMQGVGWGEEFQEFQPMVRILLPSSVYIILCKQNVLGIQGCNCPQNWKEKEQNVKSGQVTNMSAQNCNYSLIRPQQTLPAMSAGSGWAQVVSFKKETPEKVRGACLPHL